MLSAEALQPRIKEYWFNQWLDNPENHPALRAALMGDTWDLQRQRRKVRMEWEAYERALLRGGTYPKLVFDLSPRVQDWWTDLRTWLRRTDTTYVALHGLEGIFLYRKEGKPEGYAVKAQLFYNDTRLPLCLLMGQYYERDMQATLKMADYTESAEGENGATLYYRSPK